MAMFAAEGKGRPQRRRGGGVGDGHLQQRRLRSPAISGGYQWRFTEVHSKNWTSTMAKQSVPKTPKQAFIAAAKAAGADTDESRWEARLKAVAKPAKPAKKTK